MGYDCYVRTAGDVRPTPDFSQKGGGSEYREWCKRNYFRRSLGGGGHLAEALIDMGMGFDARDYGRPPDWPDPAEHGIDWDADDEPTGEDAERYRELRAAVVDWHGPQEIPGIPTHKVAGSNDGWHVTREECAAALVIYDAAVSAGRTHPRAFADDFIPFLRRAARADGFEVW